MNTNTKTNKKGFTLIELIVVMAILGVLVLLAAPRFLGYTKKADVKRIQNDTKVVEQLTEEFLFTHEDLTGWDSIDADTLNSYLSKDELYETKGVAEVVAEGSYSLVPSAISGVSKLDGSFYANTMGKVYYVGGEASQGVPVEVLPEETAITYFITNADTPGIIYGYSPDGPKNVVIPRELSVGEAVTSIWSGAFKENQLTSVVIPNSVETIGDNAFSGNLLTSITIPNSVETIGAFSFAGNQLASVSIPNSVVSIGDGAFGGNLLTSVIIPDSVTTLGGGAFMMNRLTSVKISENMTTIEPGTFKDNLLASVIIPNSVTSIGAIAFENSQLTTLIIPNGITSVGDRAFAGNPLVKITIGSGVAYAIDGETFSDTYNFYGQVAGTYNLISGFWEK